MSLNNLLKQYSTAEQIRILYINLMEDEIFGDLDAEQVMDYAVQIVLNGKLVDELKAINNSIEYIN